MSFIPGLGMGAPKEEATKEPESRDITLNAGSEWRFEVAADHTVNVKLLEFPRADPAAISGTAEVFGTELAPGHTYEFSGLTKAAIFTHHGCTISVTGNCESEYVAEETPMTEYINLNFAIENLRATAEASQIGGPRVLVVGPENAGKTSLVKLLTAYATRLQRAPLVINLDPREGMLCLPGSISAAVMSTGAVLDIEDAANNGWGSSPIGGPSAMPVKMPLVYHYGHSNPEERPDIFKPVTTRLALATTGRFSDDPPVREAGMLVDIAGSVCSGKKGSEVIAHVVSEFSINVVVVLGSERLFSDISRKFANSSASDEDVVHVLKISKSGGCIDRDEKYMQQLRQAQIRSYFFGTPKNTLSPHTTSVEFNSLTIFKIIECESALITKHDLTASNSSTVTTWNGDFLPGGGLDDEDEPKVKGDSIFERITPSMALQNALLAVKHASPSDSQETIRDASVMGYLYVADVDEPKQRLRILSPVGGRLPSRAIVWGSWDVGGSMGDLLG